MPNYDVRLLRLTIVFERVLRKFGKIKYVSYAVLIASPVRVRRSIRSNVRTDMTRRSKRLRPRMGREVSSSHYGGRFGAGRASPNTISDVVGEDQVP
jgi:hypothetical protein